jgi:carboxymethylenebutenolidase
MRDLQADFDSLLPAAQVDRRGFIVTALGAGFALAAQPVMAQSVIKTDSAGLTAGEIKIGELPTYRAQPAGGIAPELFYRYGDPRKLTNTQLVLDSIISKVVDKDVMADLDACANWAKSNDGDAARLGITGFCWGGRQTWLYSAHNPAVKAGVAWYGRIDGEVNDRTARWPLDVAGEIKGAVLGLYGGKDQGIPLDDVESMKDALAKAGGKSQIHVYADAGHAFHADYRATFRKAEAEDGWQRLQAWFKQHGL